MYCKKTKKKYHLWDDEYGILLCTTVPWQSIFVGKIDCHRTVVHIGFHVCRPIIFNNKKSHKKKKTKCIFVFCCGVVSTQSYKKKDQKLGLGFCEYPVNFHSGKLIKSSTPYSFFEPNFVKKSWMIIYSPPSLFWSPVTGFYKKP